VTLAEQDGDTQTGFSYRISRSIEELNQDSVVAEAVERAARMLGASKPETEKVPVVLVGGIDGTSTGNRHLVFPDNTQRTSNMLLSLLHLYGIDMDKIGTSNGRLQPLEIV